MKERLVVVIAKGAKYLRQCGIVRRNLEGYAEKCNADFRVLEELPDSIKANPIRDIYAWKLLVPYIFREYRQVLFLDMDIYISPDCPDMFALMPDDIGLMAKVQCRGTEKYRRAFRRNRRVLSETNKNYFENNGFSYSDECEGDINGGVLLFRPSLVADMFKEYYDSSLESNPLYTGDEPALAYLAQSKGIFLHLDESFNSELCFSVCSEEGDLYRITSSLPYVFLNKCLYRMTEQNRMPIRNKLFRLIRKQIEREGVYIIHFSGGYWREDLYAKCCTEIGNF